MKPARALLMLQDGTAFEGRPFGTIGEAAGETVFYTGVVGYQEVITDPSYAGTLLVLTYPIIGSYGVNAEDDESPRPHARGLIIKEYSRCVSNFRATGNLEEFLVAHGVVGIRDVDTRALTVHLREHGEMKGIIASGKPDPDKLLKKLRQTPSPFESDLTRDLPCDGDLKPDGPPTRRLAAPNFGIKRSLLRQLAQLGCAVELLPASATARDVLARQADGVLLAGGPGDPRVLDHAVATVRSLLGNVPLLGIGLGHQLLALAQGCQVRRMTAGHHGVNYPVRELPGNACNITVQHHSFVVDEGSVPPSVEVTHVNVNDGTVEGIRSRECPAASVQFHPSPDEIGRPSELLRRFVQG
jgi:carbamoyl-phosphate synthase small subunit